MTGRVERFVDWCPIFADIPEPPPADAYDHREREEAAGTVAAAFCPESRAGQLLFWHSGFGKLLAIAAYQTPEMASRFDTTGEGGDDA